jgi:hypothetical protein
VRGEPARLPPAALAYAAAAAPSPPQRPAVATLAKAAPVGSTTAAAPDSPRLDRANYRSLTSTGPAQASLAPPVAGLRRAARAGAREASATGWSSQFGSSADILPSGAFTGVAGK